MSRQPLYDQTATTVKNFSQKLQKKSVTNDLFPRASLHVLRTISNCQSFIKESQSANNCKKTTHTDFQTQQMQLLFDISVMIIMIKNLPKNIIFNQFN